MTDDFFDVSQSGIMPFWLKDTSHKFLPSLATLGSRVMPPLDDLTKGFKAILARAGTPDEFKTWLKAKKLWHPIDLYLLAVDETRIEEKIIKICQDTVPNIKEPSVEVSIRKAWMYCKG